MMVLSCVRVWAQLVSDLWDDEAQSVGGGITIIVKALEWGPFPLKDNQVTMVTAIVKICLLAV